MINLKIGDKLYKYQGFGNISQYIVTAIINREELKQYELECQSCSHGYKCKILVKKVKEQDNYEFLCMVNDDEEEWKAWHCDCGKNKERYYLTLFEAKKAVYEDTIYNKKSEIENQKEIISRLEKELKEIQAHYNNIISGDSRGD